MSKDNFNINADVAILPRSSSLLYTQDTAASEVNAMNLAYLEQNYYNNFLHFGKYRIEPNGLDNNFPLNFKALLDSVYIGHGVNRALINLLLSGGIGLYKEVKDGNKIVRDWQLDTEVTDWLDSFDFENKYLPKVATDMVYVENAWTSIKLNKGARIGQPFIAALEALGVENMRLEYPNEQGQRKLGFYSDWLFSNLQYSDIVPFNLFDKNNPYKYPITVDFQKMPTFGSSAYGRPPDISAVSMLKVLSLLPNFHRANLTERGFKWIVSVSSDYYRQIRDDNAWEEDSPKYGEWKKKFQEEIDSFLLAPDADKIQTRLLTTFKTDAHTLKTVDNIIITKLPDDTKELSETGVNLHDTYTMGYISAKSIHPQLANVNLKNQSLSGSNLREAYEMHIKTATPTMRNLILTPVNQCLKINFPTKNLKIGFQDLAFENFNDKNSTTKVNANANAIQ
jgi:hypothetical protein